MHEKEIKFTSIGKGNKKIPYFQKTYCLEKLPGIYKTKTPRSIK